MNECFFMFGMNILELVSEILKYLPWILFCMPILCCVFVSSVPEQITCNQCCHLGWGPPHFNSDFAGKVGFGSVDIIWAS